MTTTYSEQLRLTDIYASENSWNQETWKKIWYWLNENKKQIDKKTILALCDNYDEFEDIAWTLGL